MSNKKPSEVITGANLRLGDNLNKLINKKIEVRDSQTRKTIRVKEIAPSGDLAESYGILCRLIGTNRQVIAIFGDTEILIK